MSKLKAGEVAVAVTEKGDPDPRRQRLHPRLSMERRHRDAKIGLDVVRRAEALRDPTRDPTSPPCSGVPEPKMLETASAVLMIDMPMPASPQKSSSLTIAIVRPIGSAQNWPNPSTL
jgi:hypothetical protein